MKKIFLFALVSLATLSLKAQSNQALTNPVIHGDIADPTVIRIGKTYYAAGTSSEWAPSYPMFQSDDLVNWKQIGHIFEQQPEWTCGSFWAPELYWHNNKLYAYYTARRKSDRQSYIGVATASHPGGKFTDHGPIIVHGNEAIDAFVWEDNGQLYISWKAYGLAKRPIELMASKLSADGLRLEGEPFTLLRDDERIGMEGQCLFKQGDYYYLIYSIRGCCGRGSDYAVSVARSKDMRGPYEKYSENPILSGGRNIQSIGHGTMVTTPDNRMYYLCHAYFTGDDFYVGRQPVLQEIVMGDDKWPHFVDGPMAASALPMPFKGTIQQPLVDFVDKFDGKKLNVAWTWNYTDSKVTTIQKKGNLCFSGTSLHEKAAPAVLCLRPGASAYEVTTQVVNRNPSMKGLTFYGDAKTYLAFGTVGQRLQFDVVRDGKRETLFAAELDTPNVWLRMKVEHGCDCSFYWSEDGKNWKEAHSSDVSYGKHMLRWDRVARPGLIHEGVTGEPACFSEFSMKYTR